MIATRRYVVSRVSLGPGDSGRLEVYSSERYLGCVGAPLPECRRGDTLEIEYDDAEDPRGEPVAARLIGRA